MSCALGAATEARTATEDLSLPCPYRVGRARAEVPDHRVDVDGDVGGHAQAYPVVASPDPTARSAGRARIAQAHSIAAT